MKIPRHVSKNPVIFGGFQWALACNCEDTEQLEFELKYLRVDVRIEIL